MVRRVLLTITLALVAFVGRRVEASPDLAERAVESLRRHANDPDRGVRFAVVQAFGRARPLDIERLAAALEDPEWCVRREAAWALRRGGDAAFAKLEEVLTKGEVNGRESAAWAVSSFGSRAVPVLLRALADPEVSVRLEAIASAARLGPEVGAPLVATVRELLGDDDLESEKLEAKLALAILAPEPVPAAEPKPEKAPTPGPSAEPEAEEPAEALPPDPALSPPKELEAVFTRIEDVLALGGGPSDAPALAAALVDPERDVRIAAVIALDHSTGDATPLLLRALRDPNPRVVRAALPAMGRRKAGAAEIAPFLADPVLATSDAARQALEAIGAPAAVLPTGHAMATGSYAALHHGRLLFEAFGPDGAAATDLLAGMLAHDDVNVREYAARSLFAIGPQARAAAPALAKALGDPRLCVVANVALALGAVGLSDEAIAAMDAPQARVRAYAAFALGWSLGVAAGTDLPPFEPRLPVLDVGVRGPFPSAEELAELLTPPAPGSPTEGPPTKAPPTELPLTKAQRELVLRLALWSPDLKVALPAAAALDETSVNVIEAERLIEVLAPEGVRDGSPVDFEKMRSVLGSNELLASIQYAMRARRCTDTLEQVCTNAHRNARSDDIPGLFWIVRNEEPAIAEKSQWLWLPARRSLRHGGERASGRSHLSADELAREVLEAFRKSPTGQLELPVAWLVRDEAALPKPHEPGDLDTPAVWRLRDFRPQPADRELVLACLEHAESVVLRGLSTKGTALFVLTRLLGFLDDERSLTVLRRVANGTDTASHVARAALARRGDAEALGALVKGSRWDGEQFALLLEVAPTTANRALAARLVSPSERAPTQVTDDLMEWAHRLGIQIPPEALLGVEAAVASRSSSIQALARAATRVPGCATRRIAARILDDLAAEGSDSRENARLLWSEENWDQTYPLHLLLGFLGAADPKRTAEECVRRLESSDDRQMAMDALLHAKQEWTLPTLLASLRTILPSDRIRTVDLGVWVHPDLRALLLEWLDDPRDVERYHHWPALARQLGLKHEGSSDYAFSGLDFLSGSAAGHALRLGDLAAFQALIVPSHTDPHPRWMDTMRAAHDGDVRARAEIWSGFRAGRYRWMHNGVEEWHLTLGRDPSTFPHWAMDLDSNCCRSSDGMNSIFERGFGVPNVSERYRFDVGRPVSEFVRDWTGLAGGRFVWSSLAQRFIPEPE